MQAQPAASGEIAVDERGAPILLRVAAETGQIVLVPQSTIGGIYTEWRPVQETADVPPGGLRDGNRMLFTRLFLPDYESMEVPANEYSRPVVSLTAKVGNGGDEVTLYDPARGAAPPVERPGLLSAPEGTPPWYASILARARRDASGALMFKKRRAADGGWIDVLVDEDGEQLEASVTVQQRGEEPEEHPVAIAPVPGGTAAVLLAAGGMPELSGTAVVEKLTTAAPSVGAVGAGRLLESPRPLDKYQQRVKEGLDRAYASADTEARTVEVDDLRVIILSDHHKGERDGADDFLPCEPAYGAALAYYWHENFDLYVLGDVEELWESHPDRVLCAYKEVLWLEQGFHAAERYERFWGNHDDHWRRPRTVQNELKLFPRIRVREALKLRLTKDGESLGMLFLAHGHQGTLDSDRWGFVSKIFVRDVWRRAQRHYRMSATQPSSDQALRGKHDVAMYTWARSHPDKPVLIAGHTHRPVFWTNDLIDLVIADQQARTRIEMLELTPDTADEEKAMRFAELEALNALLRNPHDRPTRINPPCYFNTGCCSFPNGTITGIELADGEIRLIEWSATHATPARSVRASLPLTDVLAAVTTY